MAVKDDCTQKIQCLDDVLRVVYSRLNQHCTGALRNDTFKLERETGQIAALVRQTVCDREGNSILLLGPRGSGKRSTLQRAIDSVEGDFAVVRLNGFVHTDDKLALRDIIRQLKVEHVFDALSLSGSFADHLRCVLDLLHCKKLSRGMSSASNKALIFVLEEFELFAGHYNQSLLYNLFDIAQSSELPLLVVGITCCVDAVDHLEKRVKSRFSHRYIYFSGLTVSCESLVEDWLLIQPENATLLTRPTKKTRRAPIDQDLLVRWNDSVRQITSNPTMRVLLQSVYDNFHHPSQIFQIFLKPLSELTDARPTLVIDQFLPIKAVDPNSNPPLIFFEPKVQVLAGLSVLNLCLLSAMKRYADRNVMLCNFEMVYEEYRQFLTKTQAGGWANGQRRPFATVGSQMVRGNTSMTEEISGTLRMFAFKKPIALKAFDLLYHLELISPAPGSNAQALREYRMFRLQVLPSYVEYAVTYLSQLPAPFKRWASSEL